MIYITKFENLHVYFKIKIVDRSFGWIFYVKWIDIDQLNLGPFKNLDEISFEKFVVVVVFLAINA